MTTGPRIEDTPVSTCDLGMIRVHTHGIICFTAMGLDHRRQGGSCNAVAVHGLL